MVYWTRWVRHLSRFTLLPKRPSGSVRSRLSDVRSLPELVILSDDTVLGSGLGVDQGLFLLLPFLEDPVDGRVELISHLLVPVLGQECRDSRRTFSANHSAFARLRVAWR